MQIEETYLLFGARANVGDNPGRFVLQLMAIIVCKELADLRDDSLLDNKINRGNLVYHSHTDVKGLPFDNTLRKN